MQEVSVFNTFLGKYRICSEQGVFIEAVFTDNDAEESIHSAHLEMHTALMAYFSGAGPLPSFSRDFRGSDFQRRVWKAVSGIPYGQVRTYGELSKLIGEGANPRSVGQANAKNPLAVIIPCHRVVGKDMDLTGYAWGIERKQKLLELEGAITQQRLF